MPPKRRRKFHGLYYHSSPPKVLPMNGNSNSSKTSGRDDSKEAFVVKPSSIRIWIHDKDVGKLTRVLWAGQGNRLRTETSTNPRVRKFLETVPYVLNTIKDVHQAVVDNNLDVLKSKTEPPVPPSLITTKDSNGLTVMHKAAGLAHTRIVEYLLKVWPGGATDIDATGKTPLHWAASAKNNTRCYNLLVQAGADEEALDYRMKNAAYYKHKPHDIDRSLLTIVPEAPRVPQENHPDWSALVDEVGKLTSSQTDLSTENDNNNKEEENEPSINLLTSRSKVNTTEDTPEVDDIENGNSKLTIEEQAVMDAIEDEKIYEKQLSEKEANHEDTEDLDVDDTNGSPEVTPRNTPSPIPKDDNFDDDTDRKANDEPEVNGNDQEVIRSNGSIDENHNAIKSNGQKSATPVSPALEYEGVVQGEADDNQVQSQSGGYFANEGDRIQSVIDSGDMEQLAALVLNGEGKKLLGTRSTQPEIQAFLDNVPSYMNKIRRVHQAARNGNIRDLQAALDRRKFAIAKDEISPDGATPLHVATVFGHAGIIRYLGGRFPETTSAVDDNGRTALHYAATINDNGHFYNLLVNLGSNPKSLDKMGESAEYYKDNRQESMKVFSYQKLLKAFGADENLEDEMLSDQVPDDLHSARRPVDDADVLSTLERCFRLLHEPNRQADPLGSATPSSASSLRLTVTTYLARFLKRSIFDKIKHRQTRLDHNLFDVIWPAMKKSSKERRIDEDLNAGVVAPDFDVYVVFQEFLVPLIKDIHCMPQSQDFKPHPGIFYFPVIDGKIDSSIRLSVDESRKYIVDGFVECSRNLDDFELPLNLNIGQIEQAERVILEKILSSDFADAISEEEPGTYYTMNEVLENPSEIRTVLATSKLLIALLDTSDPKQEAESLAINGQYWPYGRGVFLSSAGDLAAWINVQEHLRIIVSTPSDAPADVGYAYSKVGRAMMYLESKLHFRESYLLGYLSSRPSYLGTALKISLTMDLPNLVKELDNLRHLCVVRGLNIIPNQKDGIVRVVNMQSLGVTEWRLFQDYCTAVTNILQLEKDMALTNSKQIAAMLVKIFRRKKNSLVDS
ncbi:uncharacterized protein LOC119651140 isoform X5 [Hermetia illucens]|uniref:uncharacterized protein LOC119651140 isoform X5 n=1 Tax=Hermetia illucens TaxID=343691 RepID=UPI0018CC5E6D|nr:uncharacterized protein LOC119651140 isoform X5 [Hermetia illucens]